MVMRVCLCVVALCLGLASASIYAPDSTYEQQYEPQQPQQPPQASPGGVGGVPPSPWHEMGHEEMMDHVRKTAKSLGLEVGAEEMEAMAPMIQNWQNMFKGFAPPPQGGEGSPDSPHIDANHHKQLEEMASLLGLDNWKLSPDQIDKMAPQLDEYLKSMQSQHGDYMTAMQELMEKGKAGADHKEMISHAAKMMNMDLEDHEIEQMLPMMKQYEDMFKNLFGQQNAHSEL
ncbi:unnamed protein product [Vitrella brassicaformis CCMP3155]|uniref:Uncharacterized protein n=1 Tax=Vitrella brassicaformis (strain CCMP3155) TaxID=1169540 RepID=A0A0G4EYX4_VITBC|nr:unnamed protein product [Vitrella brassicaformis CCMP3155]|mmetsp:Transcript_12460/g.36178  ORF Transcript_12460/g.36178 Transcript_12460/m.36178 type:complete len:230 (+) Transcript_12460:146-835(+)|eukprot:CEM04279.1 unnamed protein product [Vitrella brassicaformis CCMP3155]